MGRGPELSVGPRPFEKGEPTTVCSDMTGLSLMSRDFQTKSTPPCYIWEAFSRRGHNLQVPFHVRALRQERQGG